MTFALAIKLIRGIRQNNSSLSLQFVAAHNDVERLNTDLLQTLIGSTIVTVDSELKVIKTLEESSSMFQSRCVASWMSVVTATLALVPDELLPIFCTRY